MGPASETVFSIFELVENILSWLDTIDLVRAQHANHYCKAVVQKSNRLQRLLFMSHQERPPTSLGATLEGDLFRTISRRCSINPFLPGIFSDSSNRHMYRLDHHAGCDISFVPEQLGYWYLERTYPRQLDLCTFSSVSSFRHMYITQPPCCEIRLVVYESGAFGDELWIVDPKEMVLSSASGIFMGELLDFTQRLRHQYSSQFSAVRGHRWQLCCYFETH